MQATPNTVERPPSRKANDTLSVAPAAPAAAPAGFAPHFGIDLCKKSRIVPEEVSSWRVLVAWCVGVTVLLFVSSNLGRIATVPPPLSIFGTFMLFVVGWLAVSTLSQFVSRMRARGRDRVLVQQGAIGLQDGEVPDAGNDQARLRLIGKPEDIARVLRLVQPKQRSEGGEGAQSHLDHRP
jgi:hypothetical protein